MIGILLLNCNVITFRSNVDLKLSPTTQLRFNIGGYLQDRNSTTKDISQIFQKAFVAVPHAFPAQYSSGQIPTTEEPTFGHGYSKWI